jgi:hypothetical protein
MMRRRTWILTIFIVALALCARLIPGPRTIDDAFITYRYVRNILNGSGFVYNLGENVLGTTTPLYTLLLTIIGVFTGGPDAPFPQIALWVNAQADALTCVLLWRLGRWLGSERSGLAAGLVWAIAPFSVTFAIGGLETSLYVLLLVGTMASYLTGHPILGATLAASAVLTRPDALILVGPLAVSRLFDARQKDRHTPYLVELLAFSLPILVWGSFATLYFGSPIPHSITAKTLAYRLPPAAALIRLLQHFATPFLGHLTFGPFWIRLGLVIYPALYLVGSLKTLRRDRAAWPFLAYPWLYFITFALANPLIFRWYLTPPLPFYFLMILFGLNGLLQEFFSWWKSRNYQAARPERSPVPILSAGLPLLLVVLAPTALSLQDWRLHPDHGPDRPAPEMAWFQLELLYRQAADRLQPELNSGQILAASDVGVLGFYSPAKILDTVGLNSPEALQYYPVDPSFYVINLATPPDLILDTRPDYIVLLEVYGREGLFKDPRFIETYRLLEKIPTDIYSSDGMLIFRQSEPTQ